MKTILAAVDFSNVTSRVVRTAASLARAHQGRVLLLHAIAPPVNVVTYDLPVESFTRELEFARQQAERKLGELARLLASENIPGEVRCEQGHVVEIVVNVARATDAAYIVMGSHGHGAFYELLAGSTTHGVLHRAPCPVVVLPSRVVESAAAPKAA